MLSACLIVRNEAPVLNRCLSSIQTIADEIILVDTGSTDDTLKIAAQFTDRIFHFNWIDDFGAARNYSLEQATGDWILVIDADEWLDADSAAQLPDFIASQDPTQVRGFSFLALTPDQPVYKRALFPHLPGLGFSGRVHECLTFQEQGIFLQECPQFILHHEPASPKELRAKAAAYLPLIEADLRFAQSLGKLEDRVHLLRHLGDAHWQLGQRRQARSAYEQALSGYLQLGLPRRDSYYLNLLGNLLQQLEAPADAAHIELLALELVQHFPEQAFGWYQLALGKYCLNRPQEALLALSQLQGLKSAPVDILRKSLELAEHCKRVTSA